MPRTHYTVIIAAELIGVGEATVLGWIASRELKATNVGKGKLRPRWRIAKSDWDEFLDRRSNQLDAAKPVAKRSRKPAREYV